MKFDPKYLLALNAHQKIGSQTMKKIVMAFPDPEKLWSLSRAKIEEHIDKKIAELIVEAREKYDPDNELAKLQKYDIGYVTNTDPDYPSRLKEIYDAPVILYVRGDVEVLSLPSLAVVGSRKYTQYGGKVAYKLTKECAENGLTIVSGLALGIDAIAHQAALDAGGKTVGVLGCGLDRIYPVSNYQLGKAMVEKGGAIISEFPLGTPPMKQNFPARNRIMAGMTLGTLVVEAALGSGSLITAYQALEYSRSVLSVPGNIDSPTSEGANALLKSGAKMVTEAKDIFDELNIEFAVQTERARRILPDSAEEKTICDALSQGELTASEIVEATKINVVALNTLLTIMEMKGLVQNIGGGRYKLM